MESIKDMHAVIKDQLVINGQKVTRFHLFEPKEGHPEVKVFAGAYDIPGHYEGPEALLKAFPKHFEAPVNK